VIRFLHTSDWQLGMTRHFLAEGAQERLAAAPVRGAAGFPDRHVQGTVSRRWRGGNFKERVWGPSRDQVGTRQPHKSPDKSPDK
jgi:hypothetical protein